MELSPSQAFALDDIVEKRKSGFLSGAGGTGKSFMIEQIVTLLQDKKVCTCLTATTGIAAVIIGGVTLHSKFRLLPDEKDAKQCVKRVKDNSKFADELASIQCLIVDEVSMLDVDSFEKMDAMMQFAKKSGAPFGGIQVVLVGDFFQLPPVKSKKFLFDSILFWHTCDEFWELKEVFRQTDSIFTQLLHRIRTGDHTADDMECLQTRLLKNLVASPSSHCIEGIIPTKLYAKNMNVDAVNESQFNLLTSPISTFLPKNGYFSSKTCTSKQLELVTKAQEKLSKDINLPESLNLRIGSQVMLAFNLDVAGGLCNGSRGVITDFKVPTTPFRDVFHRQFSEDEKKKGLAVRVLYPTIPLPIVQFDNGRKVFIPYARWSRKLDGLAEVYTWHIPLRFAWATTIHRCQGTSLSSVQATLDASVFEVGQAYVALSRARSLEGLILNSLDPSVIRVNQKVKEFYAQPFQLQRTLRITESASL